MKINSSLKITKIFRYVLELNSDDERCLQKAQKLANFELLMLHHLKFLNHASVVVKFRKIIRRHTKMY